MSSVDDPWFERAGLTLRRRVRLLMLLDTADYVAIAPLTAIRLHAFAFLADVLSPIYNLTSLSSLIIKRRAGPYFPDLQWELDRLVGQGLVDVSELTPVVEKSTAYLDASFSLNRELAMPVLEAALADSSQVNLREFFRELAGALASVPDADLDAATQSDVTWETGPQGALIDYGEWRTRNYSELSAHRLEELAREELGTERVSLSPGAKVSLYVQYMRRVAHG